MSTIKSLLAIGSVVFCGVMLSAAGCAQPGVIETHRDESTKKDGGTPKPKPKPVDEDDTDTDENPVKEDPKTDPEDPDVDEPTEPVKEVDAGKKDPVKETDAGKPVADKDAGTTAPEKLPPCPGEYMCQDPAKALTDLGLEGTVTDQNEKPIKLACGKGGQETCDVKDPKKSCPNLPNPFCAHVKVGGLLAADLYNCAQLCSP
jgi:hypothetical protein